MKTDKTRDYKKIKKHFQKVDPIIYRAMKPLDFDEWFKPWKEAYSHDDYFTSLCREVIGQQLSGKAARTIYSRFEGLYIKTDNTKTHSSNTGDIQENPPNQTAIQPKKVLETPDKDLREAGLSRAKISYIKDLAKKTISGEIEFEKFPEYDDSLIVEELTHVKGIGPWTADMFLMFTLNRENVFSYGDLGLRKGLVKLYKIDKLTEEKALEIVESWAPYKTYGSVTLWQSVDN